MLTMRQLWSATAVVSIVVLSAARVGAQGVELYVDGQPAGIWNFPDITDPYPVDIYIYPPVEGVYSFATRVMFHGELEVISAQDLLNPEREVSITVREDGWTSILFPVDASGDCWPFRAEPYHAAQIMLSQDTEGCGVFHTESVTLLEPSYGLDVIHCPGTTTSIVGGGQYSVWCPDATVESSWGTLKAAPE